MRKRSLKKLPRMIGLYADQHTDMYPWVDGVILGVNKRSIIVTSNTHIFSRYVRRRVILRPDLRLKEFTSEQWEVDAYGPYKTDAYRDYMFLSYIKFHHGFLFILPRLYVSGGHGNYYAKRTENIILMARELGVKHEVIESEEPLDKRAKSTDHREATRGTRRINKYSNHGRTILQESSEYLQQQSGADFETDDDDAVTDQSGYSGHPELDHQRL